MMLMNNANDIDVAERMEILSKLPKYDNKRVKFLFFGDA